jgi:outer membrane cobalamin receptor
MHVAEQYHYSDSFQKGRLADYSIVNLNLEQKLYTDNFFIYLGVDNLFDENYEESYGFSQAGRTGYAGVRVKF